MAEKNAKNYAIYLLEKRDYSQKELLKKICEKYSETEAAEAVLLAVEYGYVNDRKYARYLAEKYFSAYGKKRVSEELFKRGIDREIISQTLEDTYNSENETNKIVKLINQKTKGIFPQEKKERDKLFAFLFRKGFSSAEIGNALRYMKESYNGELSE